MAPGSSNNNCDQFFPCLSVPCLFYRSPFEEPSSRTAQSSDSKHIPCPRVGSLRRPDHFAFTSLHQITRTVFQCWLYHCGLIISLTQVHLLWSFLNVKSFRSQMRAKLWPLQQPRVNADCKQEAWKLQSSPSAPASCPSIFPECYEKGAWVPLIRSAVQGCFKKFTGCGIETLYLSRLFLKIYTSFFHNLHFFPLFKRFI